MSEAQRNSELPNAHLFVGRGVTSIRLAVVVKREDGSDWNTDREWGDWIIPRGHRLIIEVDPYGNASARREDDV